MITVSYRDLGRMSYTECWHYQQQIFDQMLKQKLAADRETQSAAAGTILMVEHPAVYTLGKSGKSDNMLLSAEQLEHLGVELVKIDRGGDITFHGEGQIVCYPIIDLEKIGIGIREYIDLLEQSVIETIAAWGIEGARSSGASGVWIGGDRKICAIGVRASRYITMHGLALNVETNLSYFDNINPCGFRDRGVCSMRSLLGAEAPSMQEVKELLLENLTKKLDVKIYNKN